MSEEKYSFSMEVFFVLYFIFEALFGIVMETVLEFANRKVLGLVLFFTLVDRVSVLAFLFLIMTVKQVLINDCMYTLLLMTVTVMITICAYSAWEINPEFNKYYFTG